MVARASSRPRVRVAAIIVIEDKLVVVQQRRTGEPYYLLPGGGVDAGETLDGALRREVLEETGLQCTLVRPLFISDTIEPGGTRHVVNITFLTEVTGGTLLVTPADSSIEAVEMIDPASLVDVDLRPPMAREILDASIAGFEVPARYLGSLWTPEESPA